MSTGEKYELKNDLTIEPSDAKITSKEYTCDDDRLLKLTSDGIVPQVGFRYGGTDYYLTALSL